MTNSPDLIDPLVRALDAQRPSWFIDLADRRDLEESARQTHREGRPGEVTRLKRRTAERLFVVLRAAVHAGLLTEPARSDA